MKVLYLTTHLNTGGITSYLLSLTKGMIARGHQVHVISSGGNMAPEFEACGARVVIRNLSVKSELHPRVWSLIPFLKDYVIRNAIDVIHAHTRVTQVQAAIVRQWTGCSVVTTCHGFFKSRLTRILFPCWGNRVIAISDAVKIHLEKDLKVSSERICLVENGVDLKRFRLISSEERNARKDELGLGRNPVIGMVARFSDVKGQDILVEAMPHVLAKDPSVKLILVGEGKLEAQLRQRVAQLKLSERIVFFNFVNRTFDFLKALDVVAIPSRMEGFGISVLEAQACGLPIVASQVGGLVNIIRDGENGLLIAPESPQELADALLRVISDRSLSDRIARKGYEDVVAHYSVERTVENTLKVYLELMNRERNPSR